jgi:hypothetical protein
MSNNGDEEKCGLCLKQAVTTEWTRGSRRTPIDAQESARSSSTTSTTATNFSDVLLFESRHSEIIKNENICHQKKK